MNDKTNISFEYMKPEPGLKFISVFFEGEDIGIIENGIFRGDSWSCIEFSPSDLRLIADKIDEVTIK